MFMATLVAMVIVIDSDLAVIVTVIMMAIAMVIGIVFVCLPQSSRQIRVQTRHATDLARPNPGRECTVKQGAQAKQSLMSNVNT